MAPQAAPRPWDDDRALRDLEYSPSSCIPDINWYLREYAERSAQVRRELPWRELAYGPSPAERLLLFPAARTGAPLHVFIHGGYWQELSKEDSCFAAPDFVSRGAAYAALGYGLAPAHRLDEIVAMVRRGVRWIHDNAHRLGVDPNAIFLSGSSAGAHLAAMTLLAAQPVPIRGAVLLSGIYDLAPLRHTYVGEAIGMTAAEAARNSPIRHLEGPYPRLVVALGDNETNAFADQHDRFVHGLTEAGATVTDMVVAPRNHFDLPFGLGDPGDPLGRVTLALMGLRARR